MTQNDCDPNGCAAHIAALAGRVEILQSGLHEALATLEMALNVIKSAAEYQHSGDPWEENAFNMGELELHDYFRNSQHEEARHFLSRSEN
jgi:hypothetical protein